MTYDHEQASDWKQRSAMATSQRSGAAYQGWAPKPRRLHPIVADILIVAIAVGLVAFGRWLLSH